MITKNDFSFLQTGSLFSNSSLRVLHVSCTLVELKLASWGVASLRRDTVTWHFKHFSARAYNAHTPRLPQSFGFERVRLRQVLVLLSSPLRLVLFRTPFSIYTTNPPLAWSAHKLAFDLVRRHFVTSGTAGRSVNFPRCATEPEK